METFSSNQRKRLRAFAFCALAYILASGAAFLTGYLLRERHPVIIAFWADIAATFVIFIFSRIFRNSSFYDAYWSTAPLAIVLYWTLDSGLADGISARQIFIISLVFIWGVRLTYNWASQWQGLKHEDWRYSDLRKRYSKSFWLVDLVGIEMMPTVIVFLGCLPLYPVLSMRGSPFGIIDVFAIIITAGAIATESLADGQLKKFTRKASRPGEIMAHGLWAYSRHPNYFGEIMFWWGLFVFGLAAEPILWWTIVGPIAVTVLFLSVSIPLMETRCRERRTGYDEHRKKVSLLIPWFPKH